MMAKSKHINLSKSTRTVTLNAGKVVSGRIKSGSKKLEKHQSLGCLTESSFHRSEQCNKETSPRGLFYPEITHAEHLLWREPQGKNSNMLEIVPLLEMEEEEDRWKLCRKKQLVRVLTDPSFRHRSASF